MNLPHSRIQPALAAALAVGLLSPGAASGQSPAPPAALPSRFEAHRIYLHPVTETGDTLRFFTDTGGGMFLLRPAVERLGLVVARQGDGENALELATLPAFRPEASIPGPVTREGRLPVWSPPPGQGKVAGVDFDGMLGQEWFGGRVWTFDYPGKRLLLRAAGDVPETRPEHRVAVTFKNDEAGVRLLNFPRIEAMIDGDTLSLLFDTGASTFLSDSARTVLGDGGPAARATCFITTSRFEMWRERHPEWRIIERAESTTGEAMIEVPELFIAGHRVDGVWFTRRPDRNFHEYMSGFMDARVEGALGGNALRDFRVTVDYPSGVAVFER